METKEILTYFDDVKQLNQNSWQCKCPAHKDDKASLTITKDNDKTLLYDHAGCDVKNVLAAVGLKISDLFNNQAMPTSTIEKEYFYVDEEGNKLYKVVRYRPKKFSQSQYSNGIWLPNMKGVRYVLYNLPSVLQSDIVYFVEGEKDADNLNSIGLTATTTVGGASGFNKHAKLYTRFLKDKIVYILPDNDSPGMNYAETIANALSGIAKKVTILKLIKEIPTLKEKGDISDVILEYGKDKTLEILDKLKSAYSFDSYNSQHITVDILKEILNILNITVRYNEITKETEVKGLPSSYPDDTALEILPAYISEICLKHHIKYKEKDIKNELLLISQENNYNPIKDMLLNNEWDNQDRFQTLYEILGISGDKLSELLVSKWMQQTAIIPFNNKDNLFGIEGVLTLQGPQDARKNKIY